MRRSRPGTGEHQPRVCIVTTSLPPEYGGAELAALRYALHRQTKGAPTLLVAPAPARQVPADPLPAFVRPVQLPRRKRARRLPGLLAGAASLARAARWLGPALVSIRHEFDIVHVFNGSPTFNLMAIPLAHLLGKPAVLDLSLMGSDDPVTVRRSGSANGARRRPPAKYMLYRSADAFVTKSEPLRKSCRQAGIAEDRIRSIPYGVDVSRFRPSAAGEKAELRAVLGLHPDSLILLFVGGIHERKGVHVLLDAFRSVAGPLPNVQLLLVGPTHKYDSAYVEGLHRSVRQWGIEERVTFVEGLSNRVHEYMRASDVLVLPSRREGLPIAILEAMACGLAVIASDIPEIAQSQIADGQTGILVPVGDATALARAIARVAEDGGERRRLGERARERAIQEFDQEKVLEQYSDLYRRLLDLPRTRGRFGPSVEEPVDHVHPVGHPSGVGVDP